MAANSIFRDPGQNDLIAGQRELSLVRERLLRRTGAIAETIPKHIANTTNSSLLSGRLYLAGIVLPGGVPISNITFLSGSTAISAATNQWFALYDKNRGKLAVTADDTSTAWAGNAEKGLFVARSVTDAAITSGANSLTSATAAFTAADTGKQVTVLAAGAAGAPLGTSAVPVYMSYVDATHVNLVDASGAAVNASTTVASGGTAYFGTPYTPASTDLYYLGIMQAASTVSTLLGIGTAGTASGLAPVSAGTSTTGLTTPATAPTTAASISGSGVPYAWVA